MGGDGAMLLVPLVLFLLGLTVVGMILIWLVPTCAGYVRRRWQARRRPRQR